MTARFLVLGASGLIGGRFLHFIGPERAIGTYHSRHIERGIRFDLAAERIEDLLDKLNTQISHAVILGAVVAIDRCARDPIGTGRINVEATIRAIDALMARGIVPIFASSDGVYDGSHGQWREDDVARPILVYGRQKLEVEQYLATQRGPWLALRIAKVLDPELSVSGLLGPWIKALVKGERIRCATDQYFSPAAVQDVVSAICRLAESGATGVYNLGGGEDVTRIALLTMVVDAVSRWRKISPVIERCSLRDFPFSEVRPLDLSMSISKLRATIPYTPERLDALCGVAARNALGGPEVVVG